MFFYEMHSQHHSTAAHATTKKRFMLRYAALTCTASPRIRLGGKRNVSSAATRYVASIRRRTTALPSPALRSISETSFVRSSLCHRLLGTSGMSRLANRKKVNPASSALTVTKVGFFVVGVVTTGVSTVTLLEAVIDGVVVAVPICNQIHEPLERQQQQPTQNHTLEDDTRLLSSTVLFSPDRLSQ